MLNVKVTRLQPVVSQNANKLRAIADIEVGNGLTAVVCVYLFIRRAMSDEQDKKQWDNRLKITAVSGIGAITATALIGVIAGYFGG